MPIHTIIHELTTHRESIGFGAQSRSALVDLISEIPRGTVVPSYSSLSHTLQAKLHTTLSHHLFNRANQSLDLSRQPPSSHASSSTSHKPRHPPVPTDPLPSPINSPPLLSQSLFARMSRSLFSAAILIQRPWL